MCGRGAQADVCYSVSWKRSPHFTPHAWLDPQVKEAHMRYNDIKYVVTHPSQGPSQGYLQSEEHASLA